MAKRTQRVEGFTLIESLVAMAIIATMSILMLGAATPWIHMKQTMDTERKLLDMRQGFESYYKENAMAMERSPADNFMGLTSSSIVARDGIRSCDDKETQLKNFSTKFSEPVQALARDGFKNYMCFQVSPIYTEVISGVSIPYRNLAIISPGPDGNVDTTTGFNGKNFITGGDDKAVVVVGLDIQRDKLLETQKRMQRIASMYETYFTARFLSYADRDITRYYFSKAYDAQGVVDSTGAAWRNVSGTGTGLEAIGATGYLSLSAWEEIASTPNAIQFTNGSVGDASAPQIRTPQTTGVGGLPYTAVLRARVPSTSASPSYVTHTVVGSY